MHTLVRTTKMIALSLEHQFIRFQLYIKLKIYIADASVVLVCIKCRITALANTIRRLKSWPGNLVFKLEPSTHDHKKNLQKLLLLGVYLTFLNPMPQITKIIPFILNLIHKSYRLNTVWSPFSSKKNVKAKGDRPKGTLTEISKVYCKIGKAQSIGSLGTLFVL